MGTANTIAGLRQMQYEHAAQAQAGIFWNGQAQQSVPFGGGGGGAGQFGSIAYFPETRAGIKPKQETKSMVKEIRDDMRAFMREHKSIIYWCLIIYVFDHYCFEGALKLRLQKIINNLVGKVENKLDLVKI